MAPCAIVFAFGTHEPSATRSESRIMEPNGKRHVETRPLHLLGRRSPGQKGVEGRATLRAALPGGADESLDHALRETFPASDALSITKAP